MDENMGSFTPHDTTLPSSSSPHPSTSTTLFTSIPWSPPTSSIPAWHKSSVPYSPTSNQLQTVDLWLPSTSSSPPADLKSLDGYFLILIHGGAWRDPAITSFNFALPAVKLLLEPPATSSTTSSTTQPRIAGIFSLSHSLSPKTSVPSTSPAEAASRNARHPQHILDILSALHFLRDVFGVGVEDRGVLVGHSCGATMALQAVMRGAGSWARESKGSGGLGRDRDRSRGLEQDENDELWQAPALVLLAGIYDLPLLASPSTEAFRAYSTIYREFLTGAFGDEEEDLWKAASPAHNAESFRAGGKWKGRLLVVADSPADGMVPPEQGEEMVDVLRGAGWQEDEGPRRLMRVDLQGQHDAMWQDGSEMAQVIRDTLRALDKTDYAAAM